MNNGKPKKTGRWYPSRKWLLPLAAFLTMSGALLYIFLSMRQTVWCYLTDDVSIRENALDAKPRLTVWEEPYRVLPTIDTSSSSQRPVFTPNGAMMVFSDRQGDDAHTHLYASTWNGRKWSKPLPLETVNSPANEKDPAITRDGRYLHFASDRPGGCGGYDLWIARWDGVKWADVANAGPTVNTPYDEVAPAAAPDGASLFFSSNRPSSDGDSGDRPAAPGKASTGRDFDIFSVEAKAPDLAVRSPAPPPANPDAAGAQRVVKKGPASKVEAAKKNAPVIVRAEPPALPEFGAVRRVDVLNSPADDLNVCFSPLGDALYFDSNREGGLGGFDVYASRVVLGQLDRPQNMGPEINGPADDRAPALRMEGFDQLFSSNRGPGEALKFGLHSSTAREVVSKLDLSRLHLLLERLTAVKWWILSFMVAVAALLYLIRHFRDLTNLFHKLLAASAMLHVAALLIVSTWKIGSQMVEPPAVPVVEEVAVGADALAREKMALEMAESIMGRPQTGGGSGGGGGGGNTGALTPQNITVVAQQAGEFVPMPDFQPQPSPSGVTTVGRSTASPVTLENAPSRAQESSNSGDVKPVASGAKGVPRIAEKLDVLPEVAAPRVDVVMEDKAPSSEKNAPTADSAFQPLLNTPVASTVRVAPAKAGEAVSSVKPLNIASEVEAVARATDSDANAKSLVGSGAGRGSFDAKNTGGLFARQSGGSDESRGPRPLSGLGESLAARLASSEHGTGTGKGSGSGIGGGVGSGIGEGSGPGMGIGTGGGLGGAPGSMEMPEGFDDKVSPYLLRKKGKPSAELVEGLGGSQATETSVSRALEWLAKQQEADGRWAIQKHGGQAGHDMAASGLSLLCYLGWGVKPTEPGKYQLATAKAIEWLRSQVKPNGDARGAGGNMYDQAIATIAMAEAYALTKDKDLGNVLNGAVGFLVRAQNPTTGGWRYAPGQPGDTSAVGWALMALTSARMAGINVPQEALDLGDKWLTSVGGGQHGGLYGYESKHPSPSMAAEGMFCRQIMGANADEERMKETADYLRSNALREGQPVDFYYMYYGTLALNQHRGPAWDAWNVRLKSVLPSLQAANGDEDGSWMPTGPHGNAMGRIVGTALATLSLEVYYRYLPFVHAKGAVAKHQSPPADPTALPKP